MRFGENGTPPCVECGRTRDVHCNSWPDNHPARRIFGDDDYYWLMSRQYSCHGCNEKFTALSAKLSATMSGGGVGEGGAEPSSGGRGRKGSGSKEVSVTVTWMGSDRRSYQRLPSMLSCYFPAWIPRSSKAGVDMSIIDDMRPLFNIDVRPKSFAELLLER